VLIREEDLDGRLAVGREVTVEGSLRSYNNKTGVGRKLVLDVLAESWRAEPGDPANELFLTGTVCRDPVLRRTPLGRSICDVLMAVPRSAYGRSDYLPVIAWGKTAYECAELGVGDAIRFRGRFQSRTYRKAQPDGSMADMIAYEVSVNELIGGEPG